MAASTAVNWVVPTAVTRVGATVSRLVETTVATKVVRWAAHSADSQVAHWAASWAP